MILEDSQMIEHEPSCKVINEFVPYLISKCFDGKDGTQSNPNLLKKKKIKSNSNLSKLKNVNGLLQVQLSLPPKNETFFPTHPG